VIELRRAKSAVVTLPLSFGTNSDFLSATVEGIRPDSEIPGSSGRGATYTAPACLHEA